MIIFLMCFHCCFLFIKKSKKLFGKFSQTDHIKKRNFVWSWSLSYMCMWKKTEWLLCTFCFKISLLHQGGWCAQHNNKGEFIQVSFYNMAIMKGVVTMGRSDALEWVTHYKIRYQYDYYSEWNWYEEPPGQVKVRLVTASSGTPDTCKLLFVWNSRYMQGALCLELQIHVIFSHYGFYMNSFYNFLAEIVNTEYHIHCCNCVVSSGKCCI